MVGTVDSHNTPEAVAALRALSDQHRVAILEMVHRAGSGHPGGSLSAIDLITALFEHVLRHDPARPDWADRDRFILSKGHAVPALYAALAGRGYFPAERLATLRTLGSELQGHPVANTAPGIEACTGSLGQGLSIALGMALAAKLDGKDFRTYCMMGDGEIQEGQVWEAAMYAGQRGLDNLIAILDYNKGQLDGTVEEILPIDPIEDKWRAFGWAVKRIDGHDHAQILDAYAWAQGVDDGAEGKPRMIVADTIKGKGVSFMEGNIGWHGAAPDAEQLAQAISELRGTK